MKKVLGLVFSAALVTTLVSGCSIDKEKSSEIKSGYIVSYQVDENKKMEDFNKGIISSYDLSSYYFVLEYNHKHNNYLGSLMRYERFDDKVILYNLECDLYKNKITESKIVLENKDLYKRGIFLNGEDDSIMRWESAYDLIVSAYGDKEYYNVDEISSFVGTELEINLDDKTYRK